MNIEEIFGNHLSQGELVEISPLALAFVGDGVHTLFVRNAIVKSRVNKVGDYHNLCAHFCNAHTQANVLDKIMHLLDETEQDIVRRARNVKTHNIAKNSDFSTYKKATSFEALIGFLQLTGKYDRMNMFLKMSIEGE